MSLSVLRAADWMSPSAFGTSITPAILIKNCSEIPIVASSGLLPFEGRRYCQVHFSKGVMLYLTPLFHCKRHRAIPRRHICSEKHLSCEAHSPN